MNETITIWQPHAALVMTREKRYETRDWGTSYRGPIWIHAGLKRFDPKSPEAQYFESLLLSSRLWPMTLDELPRGVILGSATLVACHKVDAAFVEQLSESERMLGDFSVGRHAWELTDPSPLARPVPARGQQGIWTWEGTQHGEAAV